MVTTEVTNPLITQTQNYLRAVGKIQSLKVQLKAKDAEIERLQAYERAHLADVDRITPIMKQIKDGDLKRALSGLKIALISPEERLQRAIAVAEKMFV